MQPETVRRGMAFERRQMSDGVAGGTSIPVVKRPIRFRLHAAKVQDVGDVIVRSIRRKTGDLLGRGPVWDVPPDAKVSRIPGRYGAHLSVGVSRSRNAGRKCAAAKYRHAER